MATMEIMKLQSNPRKERCSQMRFGPSDFRPGGGASLEAPDDKRRLQVPDTLTWHTVAMAANL